MECKVHFCRMENGVTVHSGKKERTLEWIHEGLLRVYEKKNSENLVHLNYRRGPVDFRAWEENGQVMMTAGAYAIVVDENLVLHITKDGREYFEEYEGRDTMIYETDKEFDLAKLEGHTTAESLADFKTQINVRLFDDRDRLYGLGDKAAHLNRRDYEYISWNTDDPTEHNETYKSLYKSINYLLVNHHGTEYYGMFYPSSYKCVFNLGRYSKKFFYIGSKQGEYDYFLFLGDSPKEITANYTELVGRPLFTTRKMLGYHQSRWSYDEKEMQEIRAKSKEYGLPLDYIHLDIDYMDHYKVYTVSDSYLSDLRALSENFAEDGIGLITIMDPAVKAEEGYPLYDELTKQGGFAKKDGEDYINVVWPGESKYPDYFKPDAEAYLTKVTKEFVKKYRLEGIWCDMNEPASFRGPLPDDVEFSDGTNTYYHDEVHNLYAEYMARCVAAAFEEENRRPTVITRAAFATTSPFTTSWNGDNQSLWEHLGVSLPQVMTMNLCGFAVNGVDIGGFGNEATKELVIRWLEANVFSPFFRNHSAKNTRYQEPYAFDEETLRIYRKFLQLRYDFLPYLYDLLRGANAEGVPMYRPLFYDYPADERVKELNDEVMVGSYVLLAPVVRQGERSRLVYLPEGSWIDYFTGKEYQGGQEYIVPMSLAETGVFVKAGTMLPMFRNVCHIRKQELTTLHLYLAPWAEGEEIRESSYIHYEDDGASLDYKKGVYNEYEFKRTAECVTMHMLHHGYKTDYKTLVLHADGTEVSVPFAEELNIPLKD